MKKQFLLTLLAFIAILAVNMVVNDLFASSGLVIATIGGMWNSGLKIYRDNRELTVHKTLIEKSRFGGFTSVFNVKTDPETDTAIYTQVKSSAPVDNSVVTVVQDFKKAQRGVVLDIPHTVPLTDQPHAIGLNTLKGKGERRGLYYTKVAINRLRQAALKIDNDMSEQVLPEQIMREMENVEPALTDWFGRFIPFEYYFALFEGFGRLMTDSSYGLGYTKKSHPNSYVQGYATNNGRVPWGTDLTFNAAYETAYALALASLTATSADYFSSQSIRNMVWLANKHKLQKINYDGLAVHLIMIHPAQALQLRSDADWIAAHKDAGVRGNSNKIFTGGMDGSIYEGALILVDPTLPAARISGDTGYDSTYGTVHYGVTDYMANPRDTAVRKAAVVLGKGAILAATGKKFKFTSETEDHGDSIEIGGRLFMGTARPDIMDTDGNDGTANRLKEQTGSLLYWTYSPDTITI